MARKQTIKQKNEAKLVDLLKQKVSTGGKGFCGCRTIARRNRTRRALEISDRASENDGGIGFYGNDG